MGGVWSRVRQPDDKKDGHVAPTAIFNRGTAGEKIINYYASGESWN